MQKIVNTEAKAGLKLNILVKNVDFCCLKDYHLPFNTFAKVQTQVLTIKKSKP